jgi:putative addiction module killer protein
MGMSRLSNGFLQSEIIQLGRGSTTVLNGSRLGLLGDHRSIGEGVFELRLDFGPGYRIYFGRIRREHILLLTGGTKNSQRRDIAISKRHWQHFKESMQ